MHLFYTLLAFHVFQASAYSCNRIYNFYILKSYICSKAAHDTVHVWCLVNQWLKLITDLSYRRICGRSIGGYTVVLVHSLQQKEHPLIYCSVYTPYQVATTKQTGSHGNESACNNRGTVGNDVFYVVHAKGLHNKDTSWGVSEEKTRRLVWDGRQPGS
jgi:hypothetical protein